MIIQIGTEVDESRILWKHKESDEWERADIDDLIRAYEDSERTGGWLEHIGGISLVQYFFCDQCYGEVDTADFDFCPWCGAKMGGDDNGQLFNPM